MGNAFLHDQRFRPREVGKRGKDRIEESKAACLSVEDRVPYKRYSRFIDLVRAQARGNEQRGSNGRGVGSLVHRGGQQDFAPLAYRG